MMPYMRYSRKVSEECEDMRSRDAGLQVWEQVRGENVDMKAQEVGRLVGQMWRDLPADQKQEFADEYEADKVTRVSSLGRQLTLCLSRWSIISC